MNETREIGREGDMDGKALSRRQNQHCLAMVLEVNRCKRKKAESQKHQLPRNTLGRRKLCLLKAEDLEEEYAATLNTLGLAYWEVI